MSFKHCFNVQGSFEWYCSYKGNWWRNLKNQTIICKGLVQLGWYSTDESWNSSLWLEEFEHSAGKSTMKWTTLSPRCIFPTKPHTSKHLLRVFIWSPKRYLKHLLGGYFHVWGKKQSPKVQKTFPSAEGELIWFEKRLSCLRNWMASWV